ncbi:MAG TPA: flagellar basal body P-ring protein FlgI [Rhodomicrobium sp.]|nr:flagellar basal body P-ring protein FlgI [Rhodomicrobium sp.]
MTRALLLIAILLTALGSAQAATRIKDIAVIKNVRPNQLIGYGLVVGLNGTGDSLRGSPFTSQSIQSMLDRMGVNIRSNSTNNNAVQTKNTAAVIVTAELPAFAAEGSRIDVTVSSLGNATSLAGGTLMLTPLAGADAVVYAAAQGPVSVSGFSSAGKAETITQGVPTAGRIANGALVERKLPTELEHEKSFTLELINPDFATATRAADVINAYTLERYSGRAARARDLRSIVLLRPPGLDAARFIAELGELPVEPDTPAKIVIDEKSGTVVIGRDVRISPVAVAHGSITVRVTEMPKVVQPLPFSRGETAVEQRTAVNADEAGGSLSILAGPNLQTLVSGLNRMGLKPQGIIAILQAIKSAGALQAELVVQ